MSVEEKIFLLERHRETNPDVELDYVFTEDSLALRFSERHANDLRYISAKAQWLKWDGTRWRAEQTTLAFDLARDSCREDAKTYGNGKPPKGVYSAKTIAAVERLAAADRRQAATLDQWDPDDLLLTTGASTDMPAQTFDLITGNGRPPNPADYITKATACGAAAPGTPHPTWSAFLNRITNNDAGLQAFLQRYIGYCLTGATNEHVFVFAYGTGANGKSTFINTIAKIFGDYATIADVGTFIANEYDRHPSDVAKLHSARLVVAQETDKGRRWDEAKIKQMTGGDKLTARFMRGDYFDFVPKFKLFITGNHKPRLDNVDEAMRRRLLLVPFTAQIPEGERDPDLSRKLEAEWPAILRWAIAGCGMWRREGLKPPAIVTEATADYFNDQDTHQQWMEDCLGDGGPHAFTAIGQLFASWRQWCEERGLKPGSAKALSEALGDRGHQRARAPGGVRGFKKLTIKHPGGSYSDR
jgi:putative DNA primase/helicase